MPRRKIKILHVYNVMNKGGAETFVFNVYKNIDRTRFQFDFLCQSRKKGVFDDELKKMGANIYRFKNFNSKRPMKVINETIRLIRKNGPYDAIYLPVQFYSAIYCIAAKMAGVKKIIVHSHNANDKNQKRILRNIYQMISRLMINMFSTTRVACGEEAGRYLFGRGGNFKVIHNGVDFNRFCLVDEKERGELRKKFGFGNDEVVIGNVSRFAKQKNHDFFVELAKELKKQGIEHKIVLVGGGDLKKDFEKKIKDNNISDSFMMVGVVEDPSAYLKAFDVFVLPSLYEGFPTVVIESLACGIPCVLSDTITDETAIVKDMVDFESLDSPMNCWLRKILELNNKKNDKEMLTVALKENGYDSVDVAKEIMKLYEA